MNDRYIIKCIALKNIETQRTSDDNIITGKEYWYNPEASTFWCGGEDYEIIKKFYPYKQFPPSYIPITKLQNNAKIFKKLATTKDHVKIIENTGYFKCEIYRVVTTIEKL